MAANVSSKGSEAAKSPAPSSECHKIYGYVPNLIGYARVALSLASVLYLYDYPYVFGTLYVISFLLDAADGHAARALNQTSMLGAVLDMVTDRFSTAALVMILSKFYPSWIALFSSMNILDFVSHWMRMYSTLAIGQTSHKNTNPRHPWLLRFYYSNKPFMASLCVGNEFFYVLLYALYFMQTPPAWFNVLLWGIMCPLWVGKQITNVLQMCSAAEDIVQYEYVAFEHHKKN